MMSVGRQTASNGFGSTVCINTIMIKFSLQDFSFTSDPSTSRYHKSTKIEWCRGIDQYPVTFFTDLCLSYAMQKRYINTFKVALLIEPEVINPDVYRYIKDHYNNFDLVLTHHDYLLTLDTRFKYYPFGGSWITPNEWSQNEVMTPPKTAMISMIASAKNYAPGHQLRHRMIDKFVEGSVDIYGYGYNPVEYKSEALNKYRFSFAIENCAIDTYFTEKLIDCFACKTIPIYYGTSKIVDIFNGDGIIFVNNENEARDVAVAIGKDGEHLYQSKNAAIMENFQIAKRYVVAEDMIFDLYFNT